MATPRRALARRLLPVLVLMGSGLAVGVATLNAGLRPVQITSASMAPTIGVGDWVLVADAVDVDRGDIVEFRYHGGPSGRAIKRVVAVGGDVVELRAQELLVNGEPSPLAEIGRVLGTLTVPDGSYFLVGDNDGVSIDSRSFGPVDATELTGRVRTSIPEPMHLSVGAAGLGVLLLGAVHLRPTGRA
jgi:signal peptidase I